MSDPNFPRLPESGPDRFRPRDKWNKLRSVLSDYAPGFKIIDETPQIDEETGDVYLVAKRVTTINIPYALLREPSEKQIEAVQKAIALREAVLERIRTHGA